ncbi:Copper chaperone, partial [Dysosmobacter welbionis]
AGREQVNRGFSTANFGRMTSVLGQPHFRLPRSWVMTQLSDPSLPAAEIVSTTPTGSVFSILAAPV